MSLIPELERELHAALQRRRPPAPRRARVVLATAAVLLAGGTAALAAGGVIGSGSPAPDPSAPWRGPRVGDGVVRPGSARLLAVKAADPDGGPPWGVRIASTTRGLGCLETGRLVAGRLGVLGRDGAFGDDGRFHPLAAGNLGGVGGCARLDARGRLFAAVVASGIPASASNVADCWPPTRSSGVPASRLCAARDERTLYFGVLGPLALSVTYTAADGPRTVATTGPEGAYLLVVRGDHSGAARSTSLYPQDTPITAIAFSDGTTCRIGPEGPIGGASACPLPGLVPVPAPRLTPAQVAAPVHASAVRQGRRWTIVVRFRASVAVSDAGSSYYTTLDPPGRGSRRAGGNTNRNFARGELVEQRFTYQRGPGVFRGTVTFQTSTGAGTPQIGPGASGIPVGRFSVRLP
jgi:hypothetical protein